MKKLLVGLVALGLLSCNGVSNNSYEKYTNVGCWYNDDLTYTVECENKEYTLSIDNVYWAKKYDSRISNIFYLGHDSKLVIYVELR